MDGMEVKTLRLVIPMEGIGKPRQTRRDRWKQRPCVMAYRAWADALRLYVATAVGKLPPADTITDFSWRATFKPPESWSKQKRAAAMGTLHRSKPDRDNVDKALLDALFSEDKAIAKGTIEKNWGERNQIELRVTYVPIMVTNSRQHGRHWQGS